MKLIVQSDGVGFRAWVQADAGGDLVELPGVEHIIGWTEDTVERMGYPSDVYVRFAYGSMYVPHDHVTVRRAAQAGLDDGKTLEGEQ